MGASHFSYLVDTMCAFLHAGPTMTFIIGCSQCSSMDEMYHDYHHVFSSLCRSHDAFIISWALPSCCASVKSSRIAKMKMDSFGPTNPYFS